MAYTKSKAPAAIEIEGIPSETIRVPIVGTSPLLVNRFSEKARRKMLAVLSNNMERGAALLSRELSRRIGRTPVEGRMAGWST